MAEKLPNPFESKKGPDTEDYIGFSASSTPREDKFQPRRGKQNRQDNWRRLPNPFESKKGTEDYIGFSASSTPREDKFQPRRGKQNRQDNWRRFGAFEQQRQQRGGMQGGYSPQPSNF